MQYFNYQLEDIEKLVKVKKCINANPMGLGKSPEALETTKRLGCRRILIVCPSTLKLNWANEIKKVFPEDSDKYIVIGDKKDDFSGREAKLKEDYKYTIISFELIGTVTHNMRDGEGNVVDKFVDERHRQTLADIPWDAVIIDEAHKMRNKTSKKFKAMQIILRRSKPKVVIPSTGTIFWRGPEDAWPLMNSVNPTKYSSFHKWAATHCKMEFNPFSPYPKTGKILNPVAFREELDPFLVCRDRSVLNLPSLSHVIVDVELNPVQRKIYDKIKNDLYVVLTKDSNNSAILDIDESAEDSTEINAVNTVSLIMRQKQIAVSADLLDKTSTIITGIKIDTLIDMIDGMGGLKCVIFSQFADAIRRLHPKVQNELKIKGCMFTGKTKLADRWTELQKFQQESKYKYLMVSHQTGGEGLTMTAAQIVFNLDLMWTPAANLQSVFRVSRIGQTQPVTAYSFNAVNTVEDYVLEKLGDREAMFNELLPSSTITGKVLEYFKRR